MLCAVTGSLGDEGVKVLCAAGLGSSTSGNTAGVFPVTSQREIGLVGQDGNSCAEIQRKSVG